MPSYSGVWNLVQQLQARGQNLWPALPGAPTSVSATASVSSADVSFSAPSDPGVPSTITQYRATSSPGGITATGTASPITVTGLNNGTSYTFTVAAQNATGYGPESAASNSVTPFSVTPRGLFGGGGGAVTNVINYINISSTGNAIDFGDLTVARFGPSACASNVRAVFAGGFSGSASTNVMDYVTIASTGNATYFGDLLLALRFAAPCSSNTRGIYSGGFQSSASSNLIEYITIASTGNAIYFGDLSSERNSAGGCGSSTRGVIGGGINGSTTTNTVEYITIATLGNATDFGDLTVARQRLAACSTSTRGVFGGGTTTSSDSNVVNVIDYITIASTGNAIDFGDLTVSRNAIGACSSTTLGVFAGGFNGSLGTTYATMDYVTIASTGNASNFGDLPVATANVGGCSNVHGGL